jgi:hypothetical protein
VARIVSTSDLPSNSRRPSVSSHSTTPAANTSLRASTSPPSICSGAMYANLPRTLPSSVR